jgi:hypothetical protein
VKLLNGPYTRAGGEAVQEFCSVHFSDYSAFNVQLRPLTTQEVAIVAAVLQTLGSPSKEYLSDF